ncbi:hypothetical protein D3C81_1298120 [compost metagenome]
MDVAGLAFGSLDRLGRGALAQRHEDIGQAELFRQLQLAQVGGEEVLHFLRADLDAFGHPALAYATDDHLAAYLLAGVVVGQAVAGEGGTELLEAEVVALGDGRHRPVQFLVADADAGALAHLQLQVLDDQAFQHLRRQGVAWRQVAAALGQVLPHFVEALVELALHDHVVVDDGYHAVERLDLGLGRAAAQQGAQREGEQTIDKLGLHVHGNLECLGRGRTLPGCQPRRRGP